MHEVFVAFNPDTDDLETLPGLVMNALEDTWSDYQIPTFIREIQQAEPEDYLEVACTYVTLVTNALNISRIEVIRSEIKSLSAEISHGSQAWEDGEDACAMAECDPSDQYCKSMEIDELQKELNALLVRPC